MTHEHKIRRSQAIRALRGLQTQPEFASMVGVTPVQVSRWENGWGISLRSARRLVELGLDPAYVLPSAPAGTSAPAELSERGAA
jgi:transcriptional regulator with XRE-family HTH domain